MTKDLSLLTYFALCTISRINTKKPHQTFTVGNVPETKTKQKILKAAKEKNALSSKENNHKIDIEFLNRSSVTQKTL